MNHFLYHIASGHAFFTGLGLIVLAVLLSTRPPNRFLAMLSTLLALVGAILVAISGTPLSLPFYILAALVLVAWLIVERLPPDRMTRLRVPLRAAAIGACLLGVSWELPFHLMPAVPTRPSLPVHVIGDSVSAGMNEGETTWPRILRDETGIDVRDHSQMGATVESALRQAEAVTGPGTVVLEIGGNDLLGPHDGTPLDAFEQHLDTLLERVSREERAVVLLELPLPPFRNPYGAIQRRLAKEHGVLLVPKRFLMKLFADEHATVDGIHLSRAGHRTMASQVETLLKKGAD